MREKDTRRLEMVLHIRAFCVEHRALFAKVKDFDQVMADLDAGIAALGAHLDAQDAGLASASASAAQRAEARSALQRALETIRTFAATLNTPGLDETFQLRKSYPDRALMARARTFADQAAPIAEALVERGLPDTAIADLPRQIESLDRAIAAGKTGRDKHKAARAGIDESLKAARIITKRLDAVVLRGARRDKTTLQQWRDARRVGPSRTTVAASPEPPAPTTPSEKTEAA
jgi:tetratricopeptide (TPR) repeat protein